MSTPSGSNPQPAVFVSYAREDAAAVRGLCDALRAVGVEVWFDENELRGGDAWDRAIRRQIRDCALFVPVISANTQARPEGYFRLEWHLAEQRSLLIAKGRAFIVPVGIDETREVEALVPDAFLAVQWSRPIRQAPRQARGPELVETAQGLQPSSDAKLAQFVAQVQRLLAQPQSSSQRSNPGVAGLAKAGGPGSTTPATNQPSIPDYELLRQIGRGSYGDVWLARGATGIWRAIKIVWRERFADAEPFEREWRGLKEFAAISLGESAQMALLHVGRNDEAGFFYYVMELADDAERGRAIELATYVPLTLTQLRARRTRLPADECVRYGAELARVLAGLHRRGLVHRDIKPSNVILVGGVPKLADIGLVAPTNDARTFVGTEGYVPPEGPGSPGADVFALGKMLYELATGLDRQEFPQLPPDLSRLPDHRALLALNEIILRACDLLPEKRYRDAGALLADLTALQSGRPMRRARRWPYLTLAAAAVVMGGAAYFALWPVGKEMPPPAPKAVAKPRGIAVLPFENLDAAGEAYFAAGVTEEVTQQLSKIRALRLMSRAAVARFSGGAAELPAMSRELGIGAILTGSVRRAGNVVRIGVQLLAAPSGETLWSEQYERESKDIFAVQTDVAKSVARALQASLTPAERARIERPPTENTEAYELYLKAGTIPLAESIDLLKKAIALDSRFGLAYSALARLYVFLARRTGRDDLNRAVQAARTAVALDPQMARAHQALATALLGVGQENEARQAFQRAIELDPNSHAGLNDLSLLETNSGHPDQGLYWAKRAFQAAPNLANSFYHVGVPLQALDDASAERWLRAGEARFPVDHPTAGHRLQMMLAVGELRRGQPAAALQRMRDAVAALPRNGECQGHLTDIAVLAGAPDASERIDQALQQGPGAIIGYSGYTPRTLRAFLWMKAGDRERALPLIDAALAQNRTAIAGGDRSQSPRYENAALHLMRGDRAAALEWLEGAANAGFKDAAFLKVDPLLAPLANEPRFIQVVERINRDLREMRARVDLSDLDELAGVGVLAPKPANAPAVSPPITRDDPGAPPSKISAPSPDEKSTANDKSLV